LAVANIALFRIRKTMAQQIQKRQQELLQKQETLDKCKATLKQEFIGIDNVIDEVVDAISSWYLFPDLQEKPVVINLWGLTGVGKSSLVNRLAELINFQDKFFHFDLGEGKTDDWSIKKQLQEIYENENGFPVLLALDEFQHSRTINETGMEVEKTASRIIWQLLDSGKFQIIRYGYHLEEIYDLIAKLRHLLKNGVKVSKGIVVTNKEFFLEQMDLNLDKRETHNQVMRNLNSKPNLDPDNDFFVPTSNYEIIYSLAKERFVSSIEVHSKLLGLNGKETIKFLQDIFSFGSSPKTVDCSKGLIFVLGNLDEAYTMSHDFNPDMEADEFHEQSLKINVPEVKMALQKRFRDEQIARLGNMHIIYPAFSKDSFKKIIELELSKIARKVYNLQQVQLSFNRSIHDLIYDEGVYPTQGTRPIFTTIHQIINTKLAKVVTEMILKDLEVSEIRFKVQNNSIITEYQKRGKVVHSVTFPQQFALKDLRRNKKDDVQAISAAHEAGHAIISAILLHTVPEVIYSNSAESGSAGFVHTKFKWKYISKKEIINRLALYLAGYAAEKLVFGEENITTGASDDIEKATSFILEMLKQCGMGKIPAAFHSKGFETRSFLHDETNKIDGEAETWINSAMSLAEKTLKEQEVLLLKMADHLSDNRQMNKPMIKELLKSYSCNFNLDSLIENGDLLFYRKHLKGKVANLNLPNGRIPSFQSHEISLNGHSTLDEG
jgi:Peptidase family M41/C-terminal, D2-small domain, of ClpB protein